MEETVQEGSGKKKIAIAKKIQELPEKKRYLEFVAALLSIPIMFTVLITNFSNLSIKKTAVVPNPTTVQQQQTPGEKIIIVPQIEKVASISSGQVSTNAATNVNSTNTNSAVQSQQKECIKQIGPIDIVSPHEGEVVNRNPLNIDISYNSGDYCSVVWAYRINGGAWSDYADKLISLYNMSSGPKLLELRVKSIASSDEVILKRNFTYQNSSESSTSSANLQ